MTSRLVCVPNPLDPFSSRRVVEVEAGITLADAITKFYGAEARSIEIVATVNGEVIRDPMRSARVIQDGDLISACGRITGSGGGGKDVLRVVAMVVVMAAATFVSFGAGAAMFGMAAGSFGAVMAGSAIAVGGSLLVNALLPVAMPQTQGGELSANNTYGWSPGQNLFNEGLAIPILYGTVKVTPMVVSRYIDQVDDAQTLNLLYAICEGEIENIPDLAANVIINDNSAANYPDATLAMKTGTNTQTAIPQFQRVTSEKAIGVELVGNDYSANQTDGNAVQAIKVGVVFPQGLCTVSGNTVGTHSVTIQVDTKLVSSGTWANRIFQTVTGNALGPKRFVLTADVSSPLVPGQYDVRVKIQSPRQAGVEYIETGYWEYLQEIVPTTFTYPNTALLAVSALATDQLNGVNPTVTVTPTKATVRVWTGAAYELKPANNPAWACYDLLHNSRYGAGIPYARLIYADFSAWAAFCTTNSYALNIYLDYATPLRDALSRISIVGRGSVVQRGTNFGAIFDGQSSPVQLFTVGNIIADSFQESYLDRANRADVIEVTFNDAANDYDRRTIEVAAAGYNESTEEIRVTQVSLDGCTNWEQAAKFGRFMMNQQQYLMRTIRFRTDVDAIACQPGDVVSVQHDVPQWGHGGRIVSATSTTITLDHGLITEVGQTYVVNVRHSATDTLESRAIVNPGAGTFTQFTIVGTWTTIPSAGDVYAWGKQNIETKDFRVLSIKRSGEQVCEISALEYRAEVYSDTANIPEYPLESDLPQVAGVRADDIYPIGPDGEMRRPYIAVTWRGFAVLWNVFIKESVEGIWRKVASVNRPDYNIRDGIDMGKTYTVSVSVTGNPEDGGQATVTMEIDPPEAVTDLTASVIDSFVMLRWGAPASELPIAYYEVLRGPTLEGAISVGRADKTFTTVMELLAGDYTYWVYAVDTAGNQGAAASVTVSLVLPAGYELQGEIPSSLGGTYSRFLPVAEGLFGPLDTDKTWQEHFERNGQTTFQGFIDAGFTYYFQPDSQTEGYYIEGSTDIGAVIASGTVVLVPAWSAFVGAPSSVSLVPTISVSKDGISWTSHVGVWQVTATDFQFIDYRIDVTCAAGAKIVLTGFTASIVLRNIEESGSAVITVAATGKEILFEVPFVDVHSITVTPLYNAGGGRFAVYDFDDVPNPTGFTAYIYDAATGDKTTGSFSYLVKGV